MNKKDILDNVEKNAVEAQCRDDICSRSTLFGLKSYFDFIPEEMVTASLSLCGGAGVSSGSCGAYCSGLLAIGLKYNSTMEEESHNRSTVGKGLDKSIKFRDMFLKEFGTTQCPQLHKLLFGKSFYFTDPEQQEAFMSIPDHAEKCGTIVGKAARMACEIMLEE